MEKRKHKKERREGKKGDTWRRCKVGKERKKENREETREEE